MLPDKPIFSVEPNGELARPRTGLAVWLFRGGRLGGVVSLVLGGTLLWLTARTLERGGALFLVIPGLGVALCLLGLVLVVFGNGERRSLRETRTAQIDPAVHHLLRTTRRPYVFCTACRATTEHMHCERCSSQRHTMEIATDEDVALAVAVLESA